MKTLILYGSPTKLTKAHKLVRSKPSHPKYYVRATTSDCFPGIALDNAKPLPGETVLNTVEV